MQNYPQISTLHSLRIREHDVIATFLGRWILPDWLQLLYNTLKRAAYENSSIDDVTRQVRARCV